MEATRRPFDTERPSHAPFADRLARSEVSRREDDARAPSAPADSATASDAGTTDPRADEVEANANADVDPDATGEDVAAAPVHARPSQELPVPSPATTPSPTPANEATTPDLNTDVAVIAPAIVPTIVPAASIDGAQPSAPSAAPAPSRPSVAAPAAPTQLGTADAALATSTSPEPAALEGEIAFAAPDELAALSERIRESHGESVQSDKPTPPTSDNVSLTQSAREPAPRAREVAPETPRFAASDDTASEILKQVRLKLSPELRQATLSLTPPELGRISIRLSLEDRRLTAWVRGEKAETLDLLGKHLPELRATLAAHGIEAEHFELSLGFQDREGSHGESPRSSPHSSTSASRPEALSETVELAPLARALAAANGVDTFA